MSERSEMSLTPLEVELVELGRALAFPAPSTGFANGVSEAIAARQRRSWLGARALFGRPARRAVLLAIALLLVVVAVAAAIGFGLPGLRIIFGGANAPSPTPTAIATRTPAPGPPGSVMGLGMPVALADVDTRAGFHVLLPADSALGPPDAAYAFGDRVALVWGPRPNLPSTLEPGVSLVISEFRGDVDNGYFQKVLGSQAQVTAVAVRGVTGFWIHGDPHFFFYVDPSGNQVNDTHRAVGDTLVWAADGVTFRIESGAGKEATIAIAESLR